MGQEWRCKCGLPWTVVNIYRADDEALLAPGRGFCRIVSFKELGARYELMP